MKPRRASEADVEYLQGKTLLHPSTCECVLCEAVAFLTAEREHSAALQQLLGEYNEQIAKQEVSR